MKKRGLFFLLITGLFLLLSACAPQPAEPVAPEPAPPPTAQPLSAIYVHGESALIYAHASYGRRELFPHLELWQGEEGPDFLWQEEEGINRGLLLWQIPPGEYSLRCGEDLLSVEEGLFLPEGYTITRNSRNLHWQFYRDAAGFLALRLEEVEQLPKDVYDILIDPGHGGIDPGASGNGLVEAEQNLMAAQYLAECFREMGLKVALSRHDAEIPGASWEEDNPYAEGARVDQVYRKHAKYLLSSHLNAGGGSGFQLYSSLYTDSSWAAAVQAELLASGWHGDENGLGWVEAALYKRGSEKRSLIPRDYYFIIRETGGYALSPYNYRLFRIDRHEELALGAEALLLEYIFLDHAGDAEYWKKNWRELVAAVAAGSAEYWQLEEEPGLIGPGSSQPFPEGYTVPSETDE
ncbi:MAG: N-acetylmuramoyl-L-alanine amidase [Bacillota bacterium]|nr:N-acetylmuramoyl-L-alanine amidase [Bacillota bacterium]